MVVKINKDILNSINKNTKLIRYPNLCNRLKTQFNPSNENEVSIYEIESISKYGGVTTMPVCMMHLASSIKSGLGRARLNINKEELANGFWWYDNEVIDSKPTVSSLITQYEDKIGDIIRSINSDTSDKFMLNNVGKISSAIMRSIELYNEKIGAIDESHYLVLALNQLEKFNLELCSTFNVTHNSRLFTPKYKINGKYTDKGEVNLKCHNNEGYTSDYIIDKNYVADVYSSNDKIYYNVKGINFTPDRLLEFFKPIKITIQEFKN